MSVDIFKQTGQKSFCVMLHDVQSFRFLIMKDTFDAQQVQGEAAIIFDHQAVQNVEGASVFWIRQLAAIGGEQEALEDWQTKRDHTRRGIVEVISNDSERSRT